MQVSEQYAKAIANSKRVRWDIDADVIRGRDFDYGAPFLPEGLSLADEMPFLTAKQRVLLSQVEGRTYAYLFGLCERFIAAKVVGLTATHALGSQVAMEALVRMADEELKHQELFRRLEEMMASRMPAGYQRTADADAVANLVLSHSNWSVLALTLHIELFTLAHYRASIGGEAGACPLWKDVFRAHWQEESQHAVLDELEFLREDARVGKAEREEAVGDLISLVGAVDGMLQQQAKADAAWFMQIAGVDGSRASAVEDAILKSYRWQYIVSGVMQPRFQRVLFGTLDAKQQQRIGDALAPLMYAQPAVASPVTAEA
jgi:hypothetical protein